MATNRMYLMHRPSRKAVYLGKRLQRDWRSPEEVAKSIKALFDFVCSSNTAWSVDDFCVAMETEGDGATLVDLDWCDGEPNPSGPRWVDELGLKTMHPLPPEIPS